MLPVVAIVGRPNVGKSTLFNALTRTRNALVANMPGVTRDRQYGIARHGKKSFVLIDTGGLVSQADGIEYLTARQVHQAIAEADLIHFVVSARDGLTAEDREVAAILRKAAKPLLLVVNKTDGLDRRTATLDFEQLGMGESIGVSAEHRHGIDELIDTSIDALPQPEADSAESTESDLTYESAESETAEQETSEGEPSEDSKVLRLAIIGRPNVGKSTLVNRLLGEERVLTFDMPGTTRDTISIRMERDGQQYELIDTAGVRRRANIEDGVEKFSTIKALQAIERAHVVVVMLDAREGLTDQDLNLLSHVMEQGRALVLAFNKWDGLDADHRYRVKTELERRLTFLPWARRVTISALHGSGLQELLDAVTQAWRSANRDFSTPELTRVLTAAYEAHQPPMKLGRTARLRYAHAGGKRPPRIVIHGSRTETLPDSYTRYLANRFITHFKLKGTPIVLEYRNSENPYKGRKNVLTKRQQDKKQRLKKFVNKKKKG